MSLMQICQCPIGGEFTVVTFGSCNLLACVLAIEYGMHVATITRFKIYHTVGVALLSGRFGIMIVGGPLSSEVLLLLLSPNRRT